MQCKVDKDLFRRYYIVRLNNPWRIRWDMIVMVLAIWNCIIEPLQIAFKPAEFKDQAMIIFGTVLDIIFIVDILLNFRTSYSHPLTGDEILQPK